MTTTINRLRIVVRDGAEALYRKGKGWLEAYPILQKGLAVLSWLSLIVLILSLIFVEASREMMVQFLWSFYLIIQFWLLCRSKTLSWKHYIVFFFIGAYLVSFITALTLNVTHGIFGGRTSDTWSQAVVTPIVEEIYKVLPLLVYLFFSRRARSLSLIDYGLIGFASGAGFQFVEETARRWISGWFPYGTTLLGGQSIHWELFDLFPGYFEESWLPDRMMPGHALHAALTAIGIGIAIRLYKHYKAYIVILPGFLLVWSIIGHADWNGQYSLPDWVGKLHDMFGSGYAVEPVLLAFLIMATTHDYIQLNKVRDRLPMLKGERWILPTTEVWIMVKSAFVDRASFHSYMHFFRVRRDEAFIHLYGKEEAQERLPDIRQALQKYGKALALALLLGVFVVAAAGLVLDSAVLSEKESCLACQFDRLQSWWDRLEWYEQGAIILGAIALSMLFVSFWPAVGIGMTLSGVAGSGHEIAASIRDPKRLLTPSTAVALGTEMLLSRIPLGRLFGGSRAPSASLGGGGAGRGGAGSGGSGRGGEGGGSGRGGDGGEGSGGSGRSADQEMRRGMAESPSSDKWGTLSDGTNQGIKHYADYWDKYPERVPSLAQRLGVDPSDFDLSVRGFENFTSQAERVVQQGVHRHVNGKDIYFIEGAQKAKKGVVVILKDGKLQSMMPSDPRSFNKLQ
ncbi:PrsW family intramembrane metalloprotease [Paenibacillus senegalensis]|uniref:PrsW family intramembrane metalloprotease n=1 Tax=Paenibacillus senegalensis TaxID=1465766 RepID=UPI0002882F6A|nr:PrsW family glutamic-type intramembrane protease [Paenibacillus senegalensis]